MQPTAWNRPHAACSVEASCTWCSYTEVTDWITSNQTRNRKITSLLGNFTVAIKLCKWVSRNQLIKFCCGCKGHWNLSFSCVAGRGFMRHLQTKNKLQVTYVHFPAISCASRTVVYELWCLVIALRELYTAYWVHTWVQSQWESGNGTSLQKLGMDKKIWMQKKIIQTYIV
jgi:hypothetical protein